MPEHAVHLPPASASAAWIELGFYRPALHVVLHVPVQFSIANGPISKEFGFCKAEMGTIITTALLAYACGLIINGLLADRLGGKRAMLIGAPERS